MGKTQETKTATLAKVNAGIFVFARDSLANSSEWEFLCECGRPECHDVIPLTLEAYIAIRDERGAVLAPGHHPSQVERARRLGEDAAALRAKAEHQARRARKNRGPGISEP